MRYERVTGMVLAAGLMLMPACGVSLNKNWGRSFEEQKTAQVLNPDAGKEARPMEGLDGKSVSKSVEAYQNSFGKGSKGGGDTEGGGGAGNLFDALSMPIMK